MEAAGGGEAAVEAAAQSGLGREAGSGPIKRAARVGEERIEGGLGALKGKGHAVTGKRRDEPVSVAESDGIGHEGLRTERKGGHGAERCGIVLGKSEACGEGVEAGGVEIGGEQGGSGACETALAEEATEVYLAAFDSGEPDVG